MRKTLKMHKSKGRTTHMLPPQSAKCCWVLSSRQYYSSPKWLLMCRAGRKTLLTHSPDKY